MWHWDKNLVIFGRHLESFRLFSLVEVQFHRGLRSQSPCVQRQSHAQLAAREDARPGLNCRERRARAARAAKRRAPAAPTPASPSLSPRRRPGERRAAAPSGSDQRSSAACLAAIKRPTAAAEQRAGGRPGNETGHWLEGHPLAGPRSRS